MQMSRYCHKCTKSPKTPQWLYSDPWEYLETVFGIDCDRDCVRVQLWDCEWHIGTTVTQNLADGPAV